MRRFPSTALITAMALAALASGALAQGAQPQTTQPAPSGSGLGPTTTHPSQIDKGQNMILPSAGQAGPSAAPTMVFDCKANPQHCTTPANPADKATAPQPSAPQPSAPKP